MAICHVRCCVHGTVSVKSGLYVLRVLSAVYGIKENKKAENLPVWR